MNTIRVFTASAGVVQTLSVSPATNKIVMSNEQDFSQEKPAVVLAQEVLSKKKINIDNENLRKIYI